MTKAFTTDVFLYQCFHVPYQSTAVCVLVLISIGQPVYNQEVSYPPL